MSKRDFLVTALVGLLVTALVPVGGSCGVVLAGEHACCTVERAASPPSCCAAEDEPSGPSHNGSAELCDCAHPAATPAVAAAATELRPGDHAAVEAVTVVADPVPPTRTTRVAADSTFRAHPPPPAFLMSCSFLT